jgi:hypothetical protein
LYDSGSGCPYGSHEFSGQKGLIMKRIAYVLMVFGVCGCCYQEHKSTEPLIIMKKVYRDKTEHVYLPNDYGFLIHHVDNMTPEYYLYDKPTHKIKLTSDFSEFLAGLRKFPRGVKVDRIHGCATTAGGMSEKNKRQLQKVIKARKFKLTDMDDGNYTVCTCETVSADWFATVRN